MLSQPQFDRACKLLQECLKELPGWLEVSFADRDGGYTREFFLWSHVDERLGRPALAAAIYVNRKTLIIQRFGKTNPQLESTLAQYEQKPRVWEEPIKDMLKTAGADGDPDVLDCATDLLKRAEGVQPGITGGVVGQINAEGGRVVTIAGDQTGTINMGDRGR